MGRKRHQLRSYHAKPKAGGFAKKKSDKTVCINFLESVKAEWESKIVFALREGVSSCFSIIYRKSNNVTVKDTYPVPEVVEGLDLFDKGRIISTMKRNYG